MPDEIPNTNVDPVQEVVQTVTAPTVITPPVAVNANPVPEQVTTAFRDIGILIGFGTALLGFVSKHDIKGAVDFLQSSAAFPAIGVLIGAGTFLYRQLKARRTTATQTTMANSASNSVAIVVHQTLWQRIGAAFQVLRGSK